MSSELNGRRINLALPAESLLLTKATGAVPHTGGKKIDAADEYYQAITRWLEADAPLDAPTVALPVSMEVFPPSAVLDGKGEKQRIVVRAKYADGTDRDPDSALHRWRAAELEDELRVSPVAPPGGRI